MKKIILLLLLVGAAANLNATMPRDQDTGGGPVAKPAVLPNSCLRVHDVGNVWFSITNFGFFGSQDGEYEDCGGKYLVAPDCQFPAGSNIDYLFQGALWIGAAVDTVNLQGIPILDTIVSIGNDGWWGQVFEMFPDLPPGGVIEVRSTRPSDVYPFGSNEGARSEQDYIAVYTDTVTTGIIVTQDPNDARVHIPLGIEITQKSYAWSYEYAEDFILFDFDIANLGHRTLKDLWVGMYIDADVGHTSEPVYTDEWGAQDDICGFDTVYILIDGADTSVNRINTAWIADNDGQPYFGAYEPRSPTGVSGVRVVRTPLPAESLSYSFNWWISNIDATKDWGPRRVEFGSEPFPGGGIGTPGGDKAKYKVMSNGEFDYDQIWCALSREGWIAPPSTAATLANGYDTRYLFAFGPFDTIRANDTLRLTTAYICGEGFHTNPQNFEDHLNGYETVEASIQVYFDGLDFTDFATNSQWADWVYDNPGVDTDGDGFRGEYRITASGDTFWFRGDGVPDFAGPPPPPAPKLTFITSKNQVRLEWDGKETESEEDLFSGVRDFEGYRVYKSTTGRLDDFSILGDFDIVDYDYMWWDTTLSPPQWSKWKFPPKKESDFQAGFDRAHPRTIDLWPEPYSDSTTIPRNLGQFVPYGPNTGLETIALDLDDTLYTYTLTGISESQGLYFAVTAYDFGNPVTKLSPLESAPSINARLVYPIDRGASGKVMVYPNPYILNNALKPGGYLDLGYEDPDGSGNTQFDRRIIFSGLPDNWTLRIFTLDGDLVKELAEGNAFYQLAPGVCFWDLISRNTQAVVSGLYIYVIDGADGYHEIGKIAIVK
ncbi:MAG: hypothetical protein A2W25_16960 [candidate division Zixibacteria bacterium RBG_16_53_22]|nr:MAG: hypothetical protein A2W25_16960 [candidate division Zixibacteria bacterium RBG_16_53_22]